jgi:hypothetical protein
MLLFELGEAAIERGDGLSINLDLPCRCCRDLTRMRTAEAEVENGHVPELWPLGRRLGRLRSPVRIDVCYVARIDLAADQPGGGSPPS